LPDLQPTFNLLFLPLLGGYLFLYFFNVTRPFIERLTGPRLVFHAATAGLLLLLAARGVTLLAETFPNGGWPADLLLWGAVPGFAAALGVVAVWLLVVELSKRRGFAGYRIQTACGFGLVGVVLYVAMRVISTGGPFPVHLWPWALGCLALPFAVAWSYGRWVRSYLTDFHPASMAVRIVLISLGLAVGLVAAGQYGAVVEMAWAAFSTIERSGTPFLALAIGVALPRVFGALFPYEASVASLHSRERSNSLERLLFYASVQRMLVQLTLEDHKVYIGYVRHLPPNSSLQDAYVEILPSFSGYRDSRTHELTLSTFYDDVFERLIEDEARDLGDFYKVLPVRRIISATIFDVEVFLRFNGEPDTPTSAGEA
jgi:hypothetical protein